MKNFERIVENRQLNNGEKKPKKGIVYFITLISNGFLADSFDINDDNITKLMKIFTIYQKEE